uniref:Uncharacterized protein n=1 Tax=mine drainage metagenome TaxID=410659 RepID=E6PHT1_9ZZZZ
MRARISDASIAKPESLRDAAASLDAFVAAAKARQPYHVAWESSVWDIRTADTTSRAHKAALASLFFAEHAEGHVPIERRVPFVDAFAELAKAYIVMLRLNRGATNNRQGVFLRAIRYVYGACPLPVRHDPTLLTREHFVKAEIRAREREKASSAYRMGVHIQEFADLVDRHGLTRAPIHFRASIKRPSGLADRTSSNFEQRVAGLPTTAILDALGSLANDPKVAENSFDLLCMRLTELLFVGGFRIGELLTLPANTLVRDFVLDEYREIRVDPTTSEPLERIGLRYWPEKGGEPLVKWVPTATNALALRALGDIERICAPARKNARWLEAHPGEVNVDVPDDAMLDMKMVASVVGLAGGGDAISFLKTRAKGRMVTLSVRGRAWNISGRALKEALATDRRDRPVLVRDDGRKQTLADSLCVMFLNESHRGTRSTNRFISTPVTLQQMSDFLSGRSGIASVFERFNYRDDEGKPLRVKTHAFRRLLNTMAQRGGLSQVEIARWMGRRKLTDNRAYDLRTASEMASEMRKLVEQNDVYGTIADQVKMLPEVERSAFIESRLAMVHTTPHGQCASNIAENPCASAVSCLGGCRHYLRKKGDEKSKTRLQSIEAETRIALQRAREAESQGKFNAANWVKAQETVLRTITAALAIDDDDNVEHGALHPVSPDGAVIGKPL